MLDQNSAPQEEPSIPQEQPCASASSTPQVPGLRLPADADDFTVWAAIEAADQHLVDDIVAVRDWTADVLDDILIGKAQRDASVVIDVANEWLLHRGLCTTCGLPSPRSAPTGTCGHKDHDPWFTEDLPAFRASHGEPYDQGHGGGRDGV